MTHSRLIGFFCMFLCVIFYGIKFIIKFCVFVKIDFLVNVWGGWFLKQANIVDICLSFCNYYGFFMVFMGLAEVLYDMVGCLQCAAWCSDQFGFLNKRIGKYIEDNIEMVSLNTVKWFCLGNFGGCIYKWHQKLSKECSSRY